MYKLCENTNDRGTYKSILRLSDNTYIPYDESNTDYAAYLKWLEAGNTPQPADE